MPVLDGISATRQLTSEVPGTRVLILTTYDLDEYVYKALLAGASGFLLKDATAEELMGAIRTLAAGDALLDPTVTRRVIEAYVGRERAPRPRSEIPELTAREIEVLELVARGMSNAEIARHLFISSATAKTHVSNVITKLGLRDRVHGVIYAYERVSSNPLGRPQMRRSASSPRDRATDLARSSLERRRRAPFLLLAPPVAGQAPRLVQAQYGRH